MDAKQRAQAKRDRRQRRNLINLDKSAHGLQRSLLRLRSRQLWLNRFWSKVNALTGWGEETAKAIARYAIQREDSTL